MSDDGKEQLVCSVHDETCWWQNHRGEIVGQGGK